MSPKNVKIGWKTPEIWFIIFYEKTLCHVINCFCIKNVKFEKQRTLVPFLKGKRKNKCYPKCKNLIYSDVVVNYVRCWTTFWNAKSVRIRGFLLFSPSIMKVQIAIRVWLQTLWLSRPLGPTLAPRNLFDKKWGSSNYAKSHGILQFYFDSPSHALS